MNECVQAAVFCSMKTKLGREGRKEHGGRRKGLDGGREGGTGGVILPFQPVTAPYLATCLCQWLCGDL